MILYRPVGLAELRLVYESGLAAFPPRLSGQPIFYPVLTSSYAEQIARDWNAASPEQAGYVTRFELDNAFAGRYAPQTVGARDHRELWVPAEELAAFNRHIAPPIRVVGAYFGPDFRGLVPERFMLAGKSAVEQLVALAGILDYSPFDFACEVAANQPAVFLHFAFWAQRDFAAAGVPVQRRDRVLAAIRDRWQSGTLADRPLPEVHAPAA